MPNEIENLRKLPARRRIEAAELPTGEWIAASSEHANILGQGPTLEDSIVDLFDQAEGWTRNQPRNQ